MQAWLSGRRQGLALAAGAGLVVVWAAVALRVPSQPDAPPRDRAAPPAEATLSGAQARDIVTAPAAEPPTTGTPPGVTQAQWQALREELRARPDGAAELQRIGDYLAWSDALRRLRAAPPADAAERLRLARTIDAGLAARLREGEVSAAEARQIKTALLEITLDAPAERAAALQSWLAAETAPVAADPRQAEFDRRQANVVAAWSARAPAARDRATLERELEALRREVFGAPPPAAR